MKTVYLVDSSATFLGYLGLIVRRLGYRTVSAKCLGECRELVCEELPDMVMTESRLPDGSGAALCRELRSDPRTMAVPVVFVTTDSSPETRAAALEVGCADFLTKPVRTRRVFTVLEHHIGHRRRRHIRTTCRLPVEVRGGWGPGEILETTNLGEGGMFIRTAQPAPIGTVLDLSFRIPGRGQEVQVRGEVLYTFDARSSGVEPGAGVRFLDLDSRTQDGLTSFIEGYVNGSLHEPARFGASCAGGTA